MKNILLLGSKSTGRQNLLREARIPFQLVTQDANEQECDWTLSLDQTTANIARHKMNHVLLPSGSAQGQICFVLTADTLSCDINGNLHGKPIDEKDARRMIALLKEGTRVGTAFCVERKQWDGNKWAKQERVEQFVEGFCIIDISDAAFTQYIHYVPDYLQYSAAIDIQGFGAQFVKSINGSYTTIIGLPMYELRQALQKIGFF